jgi:hypothetical protein
MCIDPVWSRARSESVTVPERSSQEPHVHGNLISGTKVSTDIRANHNVNQTYQPRLRGSVAGLLRKQSPLKEFPKPDTLIRADGALR